MNRQSVSWDETWRIGDPEIDSQHRELIELVAGLSDEDGYDDERLARVLDYAMYHFSTEEAFLEEIGYPQLAAHRELHRQLSERLCALRDRYWARSIAPQEFRRFMLEWVIGHIQDEDQHIGAFLAGGGGTGAGDGNRTHVISLGS